MQLIDSTGSKHARRYTDADKEAAYTTWKVAAKRSIRKAAELLDVSPSTIGTWHREDGWVRRADDEDRVAAESMRASIGAVVMDHAIRAVEVAAEIMNDTTKQPKDRLTAAFWLAGVAGVAPIAKAETAIINKNERGAGSGPIADLGGMSPDQLAEAEQTYRARRVA